MKKAMEVLEETHSSYHSWKKRIVHNRLQRSPDVVARLAHGHITVRAQDGQQLDVGILQDLDEGRGVVGAPVCEYDQKVAAGLLRLKRQGVLTLDCFCQRRKRKFVEESTPRC